MIDYEDMADYIVDESQGRPHTVVSTCDSITMIYDELELKYTYMTDWHNRYNLRVRIFDNYSKRFREVNCEITESVEIELRKNNHEIFRQSINLI